MVIHFRLRKEIIIKDYDYIKYHIKPNPSEFSIDNSNFDFIFDFVSYGGNKIWLKQVCAEGKLNIKIKPFIIISMFRNNKFYTL